MYSVNQTPNSFRDKRIYSPVRARIPLITVLILALATSACSITSKSSSLVGEDLLVTGSVAKPVKPEGVDTTDAEVIKTRVAAVNNIKSETSELAWSNPDTGNTGTIVAINKFVGSHGQKCKKFQTTLNSFMGVSLYDGETCEVKRGLWVLSWFMRR